MLFLVNGLTTGVVVANPGKRAVAGCKRSYVEANPGEHPTNICCAGVRKLEGGVGLCDGVIG